MKEPKTDYLAILLTLTEHGVDFVIVGGVGAVLPVLRRTLEEKMRRLPEGSGSQQR